MKINRRLIRVCLQNLRQESQARISGKNLG
jgi:hypothetical protein